MQEKIPLNNRAENAPDIGQDEQTLKKTKDMTRKILKNISEYHGWEHVSLVALNAKILALGEGKDAFNAEMAGWTHDWGRALEKKIKRPHAELSGKMARKPYRQMAEASQIATADYRDILTAVKRHSNQPGQIKDEARPTTFLARDADRLSRLSVTGIFHNTLGMTEEGKPFYIQGQEVIRPAGSPPLERKAGLSSSVNALNFILEWEKMMETESGKKLFSIHKPAFMAFLHLVERHTDIIDAQLWVAFLREKAHEFQVKSNEFEKDFAWTNTKKDFNKWVEFYSDSGSEEMFSEDSFQKFLAEYNKE